MTKKRFIFPTEARLRKRFEYNSVYRMGCKLVTPHFLLLHCEGSSDQPRLGVTVSRKVGNAVIRNRVKRLIREHFRCNRLRLRSNMDISVIAKRGAGQASTRELWSELDRLYR